uniref:Major capsid protein n=1 Tax=viral metagenome TaxID=1070528 RepID=A0A2V0RNR3_9ZZZZ
MQNEANAIFGDATSGYTRSAATLGSYDVSSTTVAKLESGNSKFETSINSSVTFTATGINVTLEKAGGYADYRGINTELISTAGRVDIEKLKKVIGTNKGIDAANQRNYIQSLDSANTSDSHHAIILTMLQSYINAAIRDSTEQTRQNIGPGYDASGRQGTYLNPGGDLGRNTINLGQNAGTTSLLLKDYRDSHVIMSSEDDGPCFKRVSQPIGPPNDLNPSGDGDDRPAEHNPANLGAADHSNVIFIPWLGPKANTFYLLHAAGRQNADGSNANYMYNTPGIAINRFVFRWDNGTHNDAGDYADPDEVDWTQPDTMWAYIIAYVKLNRVEHTLAHVHEIIARTTFYPESASAEGWTYKSAGLNVFIPAPAYFRGKYEPLLKGEPFKLDAVGMELTFLDQTTALKEIMVGGLINYTSLIGLWSIFFEYTLHYNDLNVAYAHCNAQYPMLAEPHSQMAFGVGALTGRDPLTLFEPGIGVTYNMRQYMMGGLYPYVRPSSKTSDLSDFVIEDLRLNTEGVFHCPVSPCLIYGKAADMLTGCAHCTDGFKMSELHADITLDFKDALRLTNAYRLFGRDVTLMQTSGPQEEFTPWSPAHMVGIQPNSIAHDATFNTQYIVVGSSQRENYGARVSGVEDGLHSGKIELSINVTSIKFNMAISARHSAHTIYRKNRPLPNIAIKVVAGGVISAKIAAVPNTKQKPVDAGTQDFGQGEQQQPGIPQQALENAEAAQGTLVPEEPTTV